MVALTSAQREAILNGPAGYPPAGKTPNLSDPPNMHAVGRIVHLVLFIVASLCFIIRIYTKACVVRHVRMSDCEHFSLPRSPLTAMFLFSLLTYNTDMMIIAWVMP